MTSIGAHVRHAAIVLATLCGLAMIVAEPAAAQHETAAAEIADRSTQRLRDRAAEKMTYAHDQYRSIIIWV